jgi:hypothetical protein
LHRIGIGFGPALVKRCVDSAPASTCGRAHPCGRAPSAGAHYARGRYAPACRAGDMPLYQPRRPITGHSIGSVVGPGRAGWGWWGPGTPLGIWGRFGPVWHHKCLRASRAISGHIGQSGPPTAYQGLRLSPSRSHYGSQGLKGPQRASKGPGTTRARRASKGGPKGVQKGSKRGHLGVQTPPGFVAKCPQNTPKTGLFGVQKGSKRGSK